MRIVILSTFTLALALFSLAQGIKFSAWNLEDGYIVYRIVNNLLAGHGWAYNVGQIHNASTSVLNTLLLTASSFFIGDISLAAHILGSLWIFFVSLIVFLLLSKKFHVACATISAYFCVELLANNATWGLESHLFAMLATLFVFLEAHKTHSWLILGLATLARPDALLLVVKKGIAQVWRDKKIPFGGLIILALILAPWSIYSLITFGQIFPDTLSNKIWQGNSGYWGQGLIYLKSLLQHITQAGNVRLLMFGLGACGFMLWLITKSTFLYLALFALLQQFTYVWLNVPAYHWYFAFFDYCTLLAACYFLSWLITPMLNKFRLNSQVFINCVAVLALVFSSYNLYHSPQHKITDSGNRHYEAAIKLIESRLDLPAGPLAAVEVGTMGFFTKRTILDITGLTSTNNELISGRYTDQFFAAEPAVVIVHEPLWMFEKAVVSDVRFRFAYGEPIPIPTPYTPLSYYIRKKQLTEITPLAVEKFVNENFVSFEPQDLAQLDSIASLHVDGCVVDTINGALAQSRRTNVDRPLLRLEGWALDLSQSQASSEISVVLQAKTSAYKLIAQRIERPDVAKHFARAEFANCGYKIESNISKIQAGSYAVIILQRHPDIITKCDTGRILVIK